MSTPLQKQTRTQIILAAIIGMTIPCYGLGLFFVSVNRRIAPTITPREAYVTTDVTVTPILPAWLFLVLAALLAVGAWLWEGRRGRRAAG